jgi:tetratricopeptide (TPR) repeat protein
VRDDLTRGADLLGSGVSNFFHGLLCACCAAAIQLGIRSNVAMAAASPAATAQAAVDPVEQAYEKLLEDDDAAQEEADKWIREANSFEAKGAKFSRDALSQRIEQRFAPIKKAYENFIQQHPDHTRARLAYGSFLYQTQDEEDGVAQWEKARQLDPKNPAAWNNLANHFGHRGPVKQAFEYYAKAIELKPDEPVYLQNFATTVYLFRKDAMEYYGIDEKQVFDRSLDLYRKALKLDPKNFPLATDYAQSYYGIKPLRTEEALTAWNEALKIANDDFERQGVYVHLARVELNSGMFQEARKHLNMVSNDFYSTLKERLQRNIIEKEKNGTNAVPASLGNAATSTPPKPSPRR